MSEHRSRLKDQTFLRVANVIADLGTCPRKAVGAVIVREGRCVSWGFNGAPPGLPHCDENGHGWKGTKVVDEEGMHDFTLEELQNFDRWLDRKGCRNATHAEANALAFAAKQGISVDEATLYVTLSPCATCSRLLVASGIKRVVYIEDYRADARHILEEAGVVVEQV